MLLSKRRNDRTIISPVKYCSDRNLNCTKYNAGRYTAKNIQTGKTSLLVRFTIKLQYLSELLVDAVSPETNNIKGTSKHLICVISTGGLMCTRIINDNPRNLKKSIYKSLVIISELSGHPILLNIHL